jgi:hypothetical protein
MALSGLQNYTSPLNLLAGITVNGSLNAKDVYVSGAVTGAGISTDILGTDNIWTGTNDFQNTATYTGTLDAVNDEDMLTKKDVDDAKTAYDPIDKDNTWTVAPIFSNVNPPLVPENSLIDIESSLVSYKTAFNVGGGILNGKNITKNKENTFSGIQTFQDFTGIDGTIVPSLLVPNIPAQAASKDYVDKRIEATGKAVTIVITSGGSFNFEDAELSTDGIAAIGKIDYILFGAGCAGQASGAVVSGTIGNGGGTRGNITVNIGQNVTDATVFTTQDANLPSSTTLYVAGQIVASAYGACNLNGTVVPGIVGVPSVASTIGSTANGLLGADNIFTYNDIYGGFLLGPGACIFVAYYI